MSDRFTIEPLADGFAATFRAEISPEDGALLKDEARRRTEVQRLVVDLTSVTLITTPGLGALVALQKFSREHGIRLVLCGLSPYVREIFDLTRLSTIFEVVAAREDAIR